MTSPDPAAAELERIRRELRTFGASDDDEGRLLKAVDAVLELHQPVTTSGGWLEGREWQECGECGPNNGCEHVIAMPGQGESFWPCPTVEAITRSLTGAQLSEDGKRDG